MADNIFPDEAFDVLLSDLCQGLCFYPYSEVINPHHYKLHLSRSYWKWTKDVKSPLGKGPMSYHRGKILRWTSRYVAKVLTFFKCFVVSLGVCLHCGPIVTCTDYFVDKGSSSRVISTCSFMYVSHDVVGLVWS